MRGRHAHEAKVLPESASLRQAYLNAFVDTTSNHYKQYVGTEHQFSDGRRYTGYIWDCLSRWKRITYQRFCWEVQQRKAVFAFADNHSRDRIWGDPLWPFPPNSIISLHSELLLSVLPVLPKDLYVFDKSTTWTLVLTHEYDDKRRLCRGVGIQP